MKLRRRQRERLSLGLQYLVFIAVIAAVLFAADWDRLADAFFRVDIIKSMFPTIITVALRNTILYTLGAFAFGLVFGTILALMRLSRVGAVPLGGDGVHRAVPGSARPAGAVPRRVRHPDRLPGARRSRVGCSVRSRSASG